MLTVFLRIVAVGLLLSSAGLMLGQNPPSIGVAPRMIGVPEDWSHHHVVFSQPATPEDALRLQRDPRYWHQFYRRNPGNAPRSVWDATQPTHPGENSKGLWGASLGSSSATVGAGQYPAKFSFNSNTLNCSNVTQPDYVVYNTSVAGANGGQASIVAFDNLYSGTCTSGTVPSVYWAYNTGGTVSLSTVLSEDGTQVAFVQSSSAGVASLVILKFNHGDGGTATDSVTPANVYNCTSTSGSCSTQGSDYLTCKSGSTSCLLTLQFSDTNSSAPNDLTSPPFCDYANDIIWVGDANGYIHKFTGVFKGTPSEVTSTWPVHVQASGTYYPLTGVIYDSGTSKDLFVNDTGGTLSGDTGFLYQVTTTGTVGTVTKSGLLENATTGFADSPIVDSSADLVYDFIGYSGDTSHPSYINRFPAGSVSSYGTATSLGNTGSPTLSTKMYDGDFDNAYYTSSTTGNLYVSVEGAVYQIATPGATTVGTITKFSHNPLSTASPTTIGSPVTEVYDSSSAEYIFLSVPTGSASTCSSGCVYSYNIASGTGVTPDTLASVGGSSGIIIDNSASGGGSQIYFSYLSHATSSITCPSPSSATSGGCAVQASQAALK